MRKLRLEPRKEAYLPPERLFDILRKKIGDGAALEKMKELGFAVMNEDNNAIGGIQNGRK